MQYTYSYVFFSFFFENEYVKYRKMKISVSFTRKASS